MLMLAKMMMPKSRVPPSVTISCFSTTISDGPASDTECDTSDFPPNYGTDPAALRACGKRVRHLPHAYVGPRGLHCAALNVCTVHSHYRAFLGRGHTCCKTNKLSSQSPVVIMQNHHPRTPPWHLTPGTVLCYLTFFPSTFKGKDRDGKTCLTSKEV